MKKRTLRLLALILTLVLTLTACDLNDILTVGAQKRLAGTWQTQIVLNQEEATSLLLDLGFWDVEAALLGSEPMCCVKLVHFSESGAYFFQYDPEQTRELVRDYFVRCIDLLYEQRWELQDFYSDEFMDVSPEDFRQLYAQDFGVANYEALLEMLTGNALDFARMATPFESGSYTLSPLLIQCRPNGSYQSQSMEFSVTENTLTLTYTNGSEIYTR